MGLVAETIKIIENTFIDSVSLLDLMYLGYDQKYDSWSGDSLANIEKALDRAAKLLPKSLLIKEYNELADRNECDQITDWDYDTQTMDLEIFIDEVYQQIQELKSA